jgi:uncharacterized protein (TIGR03435 family)
MQPAGRCLGVLACGLSMAALLCVHSAVHANAQAAQASVAQPGDARKLAFEVASIKPSREDETTDEKFLPDGYMTTNRPLWRLIALAYLPDLLATQDSLRNAPAWVMTDTYDIAAKVAPEDIAEWQRQIASHNKDSAGFKSVLQALLAERFKLTVHRVPAEVTGYDLVVGKNGAKLKSTPPGEVIPPGVHLAPDGSASHTTMDIKNNSGAEVFYNSPMSNFAFVLSHYSGVVIQDRTGLAGRYDFVLRDRWPIRASEADLVDMQKPSDRWDIQSLGLRLVQTRVSTTALVIDHIERPSPN